MGPVTEKKIIKMGAMTIGSMFLAFVGFGVMGYISLGAAAANVDLFPNRPALVGSSDYFMSTMKCFLILTVYYAYICRVIAIKIEVLASFGMGITWKQNVIFTMCFLYVPSLIGFAYPGVSDWVSLLGSLFMTTMSVGIPGILAIMEYHKQGRKHIVALLIIWIGVNTLIGYSSGFCTIIKMLNLS